MQQHVTPSPCRRMLVGISGAIVFPPVPAFCDRPASLDARVIHTIVGRALDLYDLDAGLFQRGSSGPKASLSADVRAKRDA